MESDLPSFFIEIYHRFTSYSTSTTEYIYSLLRWKAKSCSDVIVMLMLLLSDIYCGPYEKMLLKHLLYDYERQNRSFTNNENNNNNDKDKEKAFETPAVWLRSTKQVWLDMNDE